MPNPLIRYELDITGVNPDNLVLNEPHTLSNNNIRAIVPTYGPFYSNSLQLYDVDNNITLVRGVHYQTSELLQEATLQYGKEISSVILIIDLNVSNNINISYQVLGGHFTNDSTAIGRLYELILTDNRNVRWEDILNKPIEYPPTLHNHLLEDLYGFEPLVAAIERLRNAILLTDVPVFEALLDEIDRRIGPADCKLTMTNIPTHGLMSHWNFLASMTYRYLLGDYRFTHIPTEVLYGNSFSIEVERKTPLTENIYWYIIHDTTSNIHFQEVQGVLPVLNGSGVINLSVLTNINFIGKKQFAIGLKQNSNDPDFMAVSCRIKLVDSLSGFVGNIDIRDMTIYPDYMSFWGDDMNGVNMFLVSAKDSNDV